MSLIPGGLIGPLKPWKLNENVLLMEEFDWSGKLIKSSDVKLLPIIGSLSTKEFGDFEDPTGFIIKAYDWGKQGTLLRAIPKLVIINTQISTEEFEEIRERIGDKLAEAGVTVIANGFVMVSEPEPEDPPPSTVDFTTNFTPSKISDVNTENYHPIISTTTVNVNRTYYDHEKWEGREVLVIEGSTSFLDLFNSPGWGNESGGSPPRGVDSSGDLEEEDPKEENSFTNVSATYAIFDSNPIWTDNGDDTFTVSDVEYAIYDLQDQMDADTEMYAELYHEDAYQRVGLRYVHNLVNVVIEYPESLETIFDIGETANDLDGVWVSKYNQIQEELLETSSQNVEEVITGAGGEYFTLEHNTTFDDLSDVVGSYNEDRIEQIISWIKDFYNITEE